MQRDTLRAKVGSNGKIGKLFNNSIGACGLFARHTRRQRRRRVIMNAQQVSVGTAAMSAYKRKWKWLNLHKPYL
jgi:hypothetical protein